jgi:glycolate oxidase iron-sulfur subunit
VRARATVDRLPKTVAATGPRRGVVVGLLQGCVQRVFFHRVNQATVRVLAAEGFDVTVPMKPRCCGALPLHVGFEPEAQALAKETITAFESCDLVAVNAAGCGAAMKEYANFLRDDPAWAERAERFVAKVRDISELLAEAGSAAQRHPIPLKLAYHDACHLAHAQRVRTQPRALLEGVPGIELLEPAEWEICCGSAGVYNILEPEAGRALGERKAKNLLATGAEAIAAGNPGCALQIAAHLEGVKGAPPVYHAVEILDASIRGVPLVAP